ncbi:hypothetical protein [Hydrogenophaga sp.]|uniref:hypothetical protein n=1 Tax=Hydrogenophaga sp. TaxID=1904254 RepID=UPI003F6F49D4
MQLKPQDFLVALKLAALAGRRWTYASLADELGLSASEAHACVKRGLQAELLKGPAGRSAAVPSAGVLDEPAAIYRVRGRARRPARVAAARGLVSEASPSGDDNPARVHADHLVEFALHGARYAFPAQRLPVSPGVPTGRSWPAAARWLPPGEGAWVWPHPNGVAVGQGIEPLHAGVPYAAVQDPALHDMLALFDALRLGNAHERAEASQGLRRLIESTKAA